MKQNSISKKFYAVHQPNLLPWIGYFIKWSLSDQFVYLDDVQFPRGRTIISRVLVKKEGKYSWLNLTIQKSKVFKPINQTLINEENKWRENLKNKLYSYYSKEKYFEEIFETITAILENNKIKYVSEFNMAINNTIAKKLKLNPAIKSSDFKIKTTSDLRIRDIGKLINADNYISGVGGKNYQKEETYLESNIKLTYFYPPKKINSIDDISVSIFEHISKIGYLNLTEIIREYKNNWLKNFADN